MNAPTLAGLSLLLIAIGLAGITGSLFWQDIAAWRDQRAARLRHARAAERQLQQRIAGGDPWDMCANPPCCPEDNWLCRAHCPNCTDISPCLGHDLAWVREMERRMSQ